MLLTRRAICLLAALGALGGCHAIVSTGDLALVGSTAKRDSTQATMSNGVVSLTFKSNDGYALGEAIVGDASSETVLARSPTNEKLAGISYFPHSYSWQPAETNTLEIAEPGGPIAQVTTHWSTSDMQGQTVYTLHPDGRLHRDETVTVHKGSCCPNPTCPSAPDSCACCDSNPSSCLAACDCCVGPGHCTTMCYLCGPACAQWFQEPAYLLAYMALDSASFTDTEWSVGAGVSKFSGGADPAADSDLAGYGCAVDPKGKRTVAWSHYPSSAPAPSFARWRFARQDSSLLLASDWVSGLSVEDKGSFHGATLSLFGTSGDCAAVPTQAGAFQAPPRLTANSGALITTEEGDYDNDGYNEGGGFYELDTDGNGVVLTFDYGAPLPSASFRIRHGSKQGLPTVTLGNTRLVHGKDYLAGRGKTDASRTWLYLARPWSAHDTLNVQW
jgi:hypothetical protein